MNLLHAMPDIGGVWNYVAALVAAIGECDETNDYVAFVNPSSAALVPSRRNFNVVVVRLPAASRVWRVAYEQTALQVQAARRGLGCMHWFAGVQAWRSSAPAAVTVYDVQPLVNPGAFPAGKRLYLRVMMAYTARHAALLLPMSEATANSLRTIFKADRLAVIPPVVSSGFTPATADRLAGFRQRYGLPERMWLYVAHFYRHKNHIALLRAYQRLRASSNAGWPLVLRGDARDAAVDVSAAIARLGLEHDVIMLPRLSLADLPLLYSAATALVYPSLFEGGGIPVLEAMACGCPVLASALPSVVEYAAEAAEYFDATDLSAIEAAMAAFQSSADCRQDMRALGLTRVEKFRAPHIVPRLLQAYRMAAGRHSHITT